MKNGKIVTFGGIILQKLNYLDKKQHGSLNFPVEYYRVNHHHPRYHMSFHWHNEWELLRVLKGEFLLTLDDEQVSIKAGHIVLVSGETLHGGEPVDCEYECLVFDLYGLFGKTDTVKPYLRPFYRMELMPDRFFTDDDVPLAHLLNLFSDASHPCLPLETLSAVSSLFAWLIKENRYRQISNESSWSSRIKPVLEYIEAHYNEELSLDVLAKIADMNARYFCKVFSSLTHTSPINYVNMYRIEQAAFMLDTTDLSITHIAASCGFWESSYFTKVFKKFKGITPLRFRQALRNSPNNT